MKRKTLITLVLAAAVLAGGGFTITAVTGDDAKDTDQEQTNVPAATEPIKREDLVSTTSVGGTLGYATERKLNAGASGTLTWISRTGATVDRNEGLYAVDGTEIRLLYGEEPMYRTLQNGDTGTDVKQLEKNLVALGYGTGLDVDEEFTYGTTNAVMHWQEDHGLEETGRIGPDQIAFSPGSVRIAGAEAAVGDRTASGKPVLTTTSPDRIVRLKVKVSEADLAKPDTEVEVELPDGTTTSGTVASVGSTATKGEDSDDETPEISVTVAFDHPDKVDGIDKAPVTVELTGKTREDVLSVPVGALLALKDGSFGVQVVHDRRTRGVKVKLGMFAQGRVEITGPSLRAGMRVGVPTT